MLIPIILTVGTIGALACGAFLAAQMVPAAVAKRRTTAAETIENARDAIRRDPVDHVRAFFAQVAPARLKLDQNAAEAQVAVKQAKARESKLLTGFKDGAEPSHRWTVVVLLMSGIWVASIIAYAFIEYPIILTVSGGNILFGLLGTLLALCVPAVCSILLADVIAKRREGMGVVPFSLAVTGLLVTFVSVVALMTSLAPIRAQIEYQDQIRQVNQQIAMYTEDGDQNALRFAEQHLEELEQQQQQSSEWNSALVPIAAGVEFASGFFVPIAIPMMQLRAIRKVKRGAQDARRKAEEDVRAQRVLEFGTLSAQFQDAGVTQIDLQRAVATMTADNQAAIQPGTVEGTAATLAAEFQAAELAPDPDAAMGVEDEAITAEIIPLDPTAHVPEARPTPRDDAPAAARPVPQREPVPTPDSLPDPSFDLS